jgi:hypothetical protein
VYATRAHPGWDGRKNDLGALILEADAPMAPARVTTLDAVTSGDAVRVVGFGVDDTGRVGGKRSGAARVTTVEPTTFAIEAAPAMTCPGDSGGPVFRDRDGVEELVGVTSYGDAECSIGFNTRAAAFREFVDAIVIEAASLPKSPRPAVDPSIDFCEQSCANDRDCPRDMRCTARANGAMRCAFAGLPPGSLQQSCTAVPGCSKERCVAIPGSSSGCRCYHACDSEAEPVPAPVTFVAGGGGCGVGRPFNSAYSLLGTLAVISVFRRRRAFRN